MAGVYNSGYQGPGGNYPNQNYNYTWGNGGNVKTIQEELHLAKQNNVLLNEEIHNKKMTIITIKKKIQKMRDENSALIASRMDNRNAEDSDTIATMKTTLEEYEMIIKRLNNDKQDISEYKAIANSQKDKIENYEKNLSSIHAENSALKEKLKTIANLFSKAKSEKFSTSDTLLEIQDLLINSTSVKSEPGISSTFSFAPNVPVVKNENPKTELLLPFFEFVRPTGKTEENMYLLNKYIAECLKPEKLGKQSNTPDLVVQYFNRAQSTAFLYPKVAEFITSSEKNSNRFPSEALPENRIVVEEDWPFLLREYNQRREQMPPFLMLIAKERSKGKSKHVLFVLSAKSSMILRYDPLAQPISVRDYRRVYSNVFSDYVDFNHWEKRHLVEERHGISWMYCVEFARRFTLMADEEEIGWLEQFPMRGRSGNCGAFASIDFEILVE